MKNKIITLFVIFITNLFVINTYAVTPAPVINCIWLPWCNDSDIKNPTADKVEDNIWTEVISSIIWELIQFVAVIAVIALISSGFMYLISWWEEEKTKNAKSWIIWSLVWVLLSISAWWIINMLNKITIS